MKKEKEPVKAGDVIENAFAHMRWMSEEREAEREASERDPEKVRSREAAVRAQEAKDRDEKLLEGCYPKRHRKFLKAGNILEGPGGEKARALLPEVLSGDFLYILTGRRGSGKTQMSTFWAMERLKAGKGCGKYTTATDFLADIRRTWSGANSGQAERELLSRYQKAPMLVIDEYQEASAGEWAQSTLVNIIDRRYREMLGTVIIANYSPEELRENVSHSIVDRANEQGGIMLCDWPSHRGKDLRR